MLPRGTFFTGALGDPGENLAYPEPTPVVKGKAARELLEELERSEKPGGATKRWAGSKELYKKLRPKETRKR